MRPGVDVADRLTDRRVAMTILYRETSQFIAVILFIVLVYLSVHLHVFFHSLISSSSPPSPSGWLPQFFLCNSSTVTFWCYKISSTATYEYLLFDFISALHGKETELSFASGNNEK